MFSKKMIVVSCVSVFLVIGGLVLFYVYLDSKDVYSKYEEINGEDILNQGGEYYVYFYQPDCPYCLQIKNQVSDSFSEDELYTVNMKDIKNKDLWYDWEAHHEKYDVKIGEIVDGENVFYSQNEEEFLAESHTDELGQEIDYTVEYGNDYLDVNPSGDKNGIYAVNNTPLISLESLEDDIKVAGTPTIMKINNGEVVEYYRGDEEVGELLQSKSIQ